MSRPMLEVADIFRDHGAAWRQTNAGHVSLDQLKVMSAIESCRTAALGGHVARCEDCAYTTIAYNSCLMGRFRNGELAASVIRYQVENWCFCSPLRFCFEQSDELVRWSKESFAQVWRNDSLNGFELLAGITSCVDFSGR